MYNISIFKSCRGRKEVTMAHTHGEEVKHLSECLFWPERAEGQCKEFRHRGRCSKYRSPSVHWGQHPAVFSPGASVPGIQASPDDPKTLSI